MKKLKLAALAREELAGGVRRRVARHGRFELVEYRYPPGAAFPVHRHEAEQLTVVLQGRLILTTPQGERLELGPGEVAFVEANEPHGAIVPDDLGEEVVTLNVFTPPRAELPGG